MIDPSSPAFFRKGFLLLGVLATVGLVGYGLAYLVVMPTVSPDGFVPQELGMITGRVPGFGAVLAAFALLYAFAFLPVVVMFTVKHHDINPYAMVLGCCLVTLSSVIEIVNNLPLVADWLFPGALESIPADVLLHLHQVDMIRFLSYDVAGFTLAYMAFFVYALVFFRTHRLLAYAVVVSIVTFIANIPCLWFASDAAVVLMAISIFAFALVPILLTIQARNIQEFENWVLPLCAPCDLLRLQTPPTLRATIVTFDSIVEPQLHN